MNFKLSQNVITFDFETNKQGEVIAWSILVFGAKSKKEKYYYGVNISSFVERVKKLVLRKNTNKRYKSCMTFWGHNASNFDNQFILPELSKQGYFFRYNKNKNLITNMKHIKSPYKEKQIAEWKKQKRYPYVNSVIDNNNKIMSLKIQYDKHKALEIKDSNLFWKGTLNDYAVALGNKVKKEKQDWNKERFYKNVKELQNDKKFFTYLKNDVLILNKFLQEQFISLRSEDERFDIPQTQIGITGAQLSYQSFCKFIPYNVKLLQKLKINISKIITPFYENSKKNKTEFEIDNIIHKPKYAGKVILNKYLFPVDWQNELFWEDKELFVEDFYEENDFERIITDMKAPYEHSELKKSYIIGGLTTFNKNYVGKMINSSSFDINSSYPNVLNGDYLIPYGEPNKEKNNVYNFGFYIIKLKKDLTNTGAINFLNDVNCSKNIYPRVLKKGAVVRFGETMYRAFLKYYKPQKKDINVECIRAFKSIKSKEIFGPWIDYFYNKKKNAKSSVEKLSAKLFLNSLYGKFITKQTRISKIFNPEWKLKLFQPEENEKLNYRTFNNVYSHYEKELCTTKAQYYNPVGMSIVEQARVNLIDIKLDKKDFIYCDTDSIKLRASAVNKFINDNKDLIDDTKLGKLKNEKQDGYLLVMEKKRYALFDKNNKLIKLVGSGYEVVEDKVYKMINEKRVKIKLNEIIPSDLLNGKIWFKNLMKVYKKDGVVLVDNWKQITPIWENCDDTKWFNNKEDFLLKSSEIMV